MFRRRLCWNTCRAVRRLCLARRSLADPPVPATGSLLLLALTVVAVGLAVASGSSVLLYAQEAPAQAGLVIQFADGRVAEYCVNLGAESATGEELLRLAGLEVVADSGPLGTRICAIEGQGCRAEDCWCHCHDLGQDCEYWAYHNLEDGHWVYARVGASSRVVHHGDVDGWAWGPGTAGKGAAPPLRTFDQLCPAAGATPPATSTAIPPSAIPPQPSPTAVSPTAPPRQTATPLPAVATPTVPPAPTSSRPDRSTAPPSGPISGAPETPTQAAPSPAATLASALATWQAVATLAAWPTAARQEPLPSPTVTLVLVRAITPPAGFSSTPAGAGSPAGYSQASRRPAEYVLSGIVMVALAAGAVWLRRRQ